MELFAVDGLNKQPLDAIVATIVALGFNCVRLPFSLELLFEDPPVPAIAVDPALNPDLPPGIRGMALLDRTIEAMTSAGLMVVLNNHNSKAGWCCSGTSEEGIWHNSIYSVDRWYDSIRLMGRRYRNNSLVVAYDLRNEIHDVNATKLTWGATDDEHTDWRVASTKGARALQEAAPNMLVVLSGLCYGYELRAMRASPPEMLVPDKLVYTSHTYQWSIWWTVIRNQLSLPGEPGAEKPGGPGGWTRLQGTAHAAGTAMAVVTVAAALAAAAAAWWLDMRRSSSMSTAAGSGSGGSGDRSGGRGGRSGARGRSTTAGDLSLTCREAVFSLGFWVALVPGLTCIVAAVLWRVATDLAQCSIAGDESHGLLAVAVVFLLLGAAAMVFAGCLWNGGGAPCCSSESCAPCGRISQGSGASLNHNHGQRHADLELVKGRGGEDGMTSAPSTADDDADDDDAAAAAAAGSSSSGRSVADDGDDAAMVKRAGSIGTSRRGRRICNRFCVGWNLVVAAAFVAVSLLYVASFAHRVQGFEMLDTELKHKWGIEPPATTMAAGGGGGAAAAAGGGNSAAAKGRDIPLWVGEFGKGSKPSRWWKHLMRFFTENPQIGWAYWPLNGAKWRNKSYEWENEGYGLLTMDYATERLPFMRADLMATIAGSGGRNNVSGTSEGGWGGAPDDAIPPLA